MATHLLVGNPTAQSGKNADRSGRARATRGAVTGELANERAGRSPVAVGGSPPGQS